jgi:hypothetical protein
MRTRAPTPPASGRSTRSVLVAAAFAAMALVTAYSVGRLSAVEAEAPRAGRTSRVEPGPRRPVGGGGGPEELVGRAAFSPPARPAAPPSPAPTTVQEDALASGLLAMQNGKLVPTPALMAKVTRETQVQLESVQPELLKRCWPDDGLPGGRSGTTLTFSVTYDANGREIARGISEDRRAPAGALAACLRRMPAGALHIPAPGANVGVRVPLAFP